MIIRIPHSAFHIPHFFEMDMPMMSADDDELEENGWLEDEELETAVVLAEEVLPEKVTAALPRPERLDLSHYQQLIKRFVVCGRCGSFLTGYRVLHGVNSLEMAARASQTSQEGWLTLVWDGRTRQLIGQSFGVYPETDLYYFDICCPECQRRILYTEQAPGEPALTFQVDLKLK
ncbi:MAG: hypothetical protein IPL28_11190 [Chloroflexi bacterium]|nr:hypothetical protein [Chloroflexota bacterium]